jgi:SAM-dependent methyltransferase
LNARRQFGARAREYATSAVHATGADRSVRLLDLPPNAIALDVGTGAGHTAHALARRCRSVLAGDITPEMLAQTRRLAGELSLANVHPVFTLAEKLPCRDGSLDAVTCRLAAHHFHDVGAFCHEIARVLRKSGKALIVDVVVPEDVEAAAYINDIELHRDHSHIEDYSAGRWRRLVEDAGLRVRSIGVSSEELVEEELGEWTRRSATGAADVDYIRARLEAAPDAVATALSLRKIGDTFRWLWPVITLLAEKP